MKNKIGIGIKVKQLSIPCFTLLCLAIGSLIQPILNANEARTDKEGIKESKEEIREHLKGKYGVDVKIYWDKIFNRIRTIQFYEDGISSMNSRDEIRNYSKKLIMEVSVYARIDPNTLVEKEISISKRKILYSSIQTVDDVLVENAGVAVEILKKGRGVQGRDHVSVGGAYFPNISISTIPNMTSDAASASGDAFLMEKYPNYQHLKSLSEVTLLRSPKLVIYPKEVLTNNKLSSYEYYLVWRLDYQIRSALYIDAHTGDIVSKGYGPIP